MRRGDVTNRIAFSLWKEKKETQERERERNSYLADE